MNRTDNLKFKSTSFKSVGTACAIGLALVAVVAGVVLGTSTALGQDSVLGRFSFFQSNPMPTALPSQITTITGVETSLAELDNAGIVVYLPTYLPGTLRLQSIERMQSDNATLNDLSGVDLLSHFGGWSSERNNMLWVLIDQSEFPVQGTVFIPQDRVIRTLEINGNKAVYYDPSATAGLPAPDEWKVLKVLIGKHSVALNGNVGVDELVKIAQSLTPTTPEK